MTNSTITAAGFVVTNNEAIWGVGQTANAAWSDFEQQMQSAGVSILGELDGVADQLGSWARERDFTIHAASAGLLADVATRGGAITWRNASGVACTVDEYDSSDVA